MFLYDAKSGVVEVSSDADADDDINLYHDINELSMNLKIFHFNKYRLEYFYHERRGCYQTLRVKFPSAMEPLINFI